MLRRSEEKMHKIVDGKNDWDLVPNDKLSVLQRLAKRTKGIVTVGNTITVFGFGLAVNGLVDFMNGQRALGTAKVIGGRVCDILDGKAAHKTKTKGSLGRDLDAGLDGAFLLGAVAALEVTGVLPIIPAVAVAGPKVADSFGAFAAKFRGRDINATGESKIGAFGINFGIGSLMLASTVEKHVPGFAEYALQTIGYVGALGGSMLKLSGTKEFLQIGFGPEGPKTIEIPALTTLSPEPEPLQL